MSLSKKNLVKVASFVGKNIMKEPKVLKVYSNEYLTENKDNFSIGAVIDTETTGICPLEDEILELAIRLFKYNTKTFLCVKIIYVLKIRIIKEKTSSTKKITSLY